tara:strand:+ start:945 stop:1376 length:432 start_codon:yes stop_codon:yes gene_type:complete
MITLNHDMIITFQTNGSSVPDIDKHLGKHFYYEDILNHLKKQQTDPTIHHLSIEYIDRGVRNWHVFWIAIQRAFPSLTALTFEQNYPMRKGPWKTAETFFQQCPLTYLSINWFQSFDIIQKTKKINYTVTIIYTQDDQDIDMF